MCIRDSRGTEQSLGAGEQQDLETSDAEALRQDRPPLVFGRTIDEVELTEMLAEDGGRAEIIEAMTATSALSEQEAGCMLTNLSYETFVVVANALRPTGAQYSEVLTALEVCEVAGS